MITLAGGLRSNGSAGVMTTIAQRRWSMGVWLGGVVCLVVMVLPVASPARVLLIDGAGIAAALIMLGAALRMPPGARAVWLCLWVYVALTVIGDVIYDVYRYHLHQEPFPSLADIAYLATYVAMIAALIVLVRRRQPGRNRETWIDTAVMSLAAACVVATVVVIPMLHNTSAPTATSVIALAYPVLDMIALSVLIRLLVDVRGMNLALGLLTVSLACALTADLVFQSLAVQGIVEEAPAWVDVLYLASTLLLVAAATCRGAATIARPSRTGQRTKGRLIGLAVAALTAPTLLAFSVWSEVGSGARLLAVVSIAIILLILWGGLMLISMVEQQSALLADLARKDGLTGVANRRTWDFELERVAAHTAEHAAPLTVAILDLDYFKAYNDHFGHPQGDRLLTECARTWHALLDPPAVLARYGGEEFAVLLPGIALEDAGCILDRLRRATPGEQTVSIGYAQRRPDEPIGATVERADRALYAAKAAGRNCAVAEADVRV